MVAEIRNMRIELFDIIQRGKNNVYTRLGEYISGLFVHNKTVGCIKSHTAIKCQKQYLEGAPGIWSNYGI